MSRREVSLPNPAPRRRLQRRTIEFEGFLRHDGYWDIEGRLLDTKGFDFFSSRIELVPAGAPIHEMLVRLTIDDERVVRKAHAVIATGPYERCDEVVSSMAALVGERIGPGWRDTVRTRLPARSFCTHLSELLVAMATAAYQTQSMGKSPDGTNPLRAMASTTERPYFIDKCHSWKADGPLVRELFPQFSGTPSRREE